MTRTSAIRRVSENSKLDVRFSLCGEFDIANSGQVTEALEKGMAYRTITIDLTRTTFIDASILGVLIGLASRRRHINAERPRIVNASKNIRRLFSLCEFETILDIEGQVTRKCETRQSAMRVIAYDASS